MVRKFFVRAWYMFAFMLVTILGGCILLFFALCYGVRGFGREFCDTISEGVAAFTEKFCLSSGISQRCD